jgi:phage tail-like protein
MPSIELPRLILRTVAAVSDGARALLINRNPEPLESAVPVDSLILLELTNLGEGGLSPDETLVFIDDVLAYDGSLSPAFQAGYQGTKSSVVVTSDSLRLVLHPTVPFVSLAVMTVRVVSRTNDGFVFEEAYSFTVEDRTAPRLLAAQATGQKTLRVVIDEPVRVPTGAAITLTALAVPAVPVAVVSASALGEVLELSLDTEMTPDVPYEIRVAGVTDRFGNVVLAPYDRTVVVGYRPPRPPTRRFDLWQMLPKHNRRDDQTGDLRRFISCLQEVTDLLLVDIDRFPDIFDLERAPEAFLDCILADLGNLFPFELDTLDRRRLAAILVEMYRQKGTAKGIQNAVRFFLGIEILAILPINTDGLVLGESLLGVDWVLGPSDRFARYAFDVQVSRVLVASERTRLRAIVDFLRPAHTHFVTLEEPLPPITSDDWELGLSELGLATQLR